MNDPETGNWITYNGETYNFKDLRREIGNEPWVSNTDTEVVLRAYHKWGVDAFRKMRGMFALAIWDHANNNCCSLEIRWVSSRFITIVAKDRLIFASELRALLASGLVPRQLSTAGVDSYLANGSVASPLTIVEGIKQLLPGHYLQVKADQAGIEINRVSSLSVAERRRR